ncbi:MAG: hypothetical protein B5M53_04645 [Candidatus Cloacimonas sp. 4484_209]|nr:MAG: hypothetical protein B5M53_04645 [Candidatus Cloacimonas sp. 4484_209]
MGVYNLFNLCYPLPKRLESVFKFGNPWGRIREKRTDWLVDKDVKILKQGDKVDFLYYVGCTPSYETRVQDVARSMIRILKISGSDFGILGNIETCCGNEIKRTGELGLFEMLVEDNTKIFAQYQIGTLFTTSPHCYNTFKNEYPQMNFSIEHYTTIINRFIKSNLIKPTNVFAKKVVFHDPCFLGKQNNIYEPPREILSSIPGLELVEFERSRERSLCCEGGGGRMWVESESSEERLAVKRVKSAEKLGVDIIATACPFCLLTLEDAVKTANLEDKIEVLDVIEILDKAVMGEERN